MHGVDLIQVQKETKKTKNSRTGFIDQTFSVIGPGRRDNCPAFQRLSRRTAAVRTAGTENHAEQPSWDGGGQRPTTNRDSLASGKLFSTIRQDSRNSHRRFQDHI